MQRTQQAGCFRPIDIITRYNPAQSSDENLRLCGARRADSELVTGLRNSPLIGQRRQSQASNQLEAPKLARNARASGVDSVYIV